MHAQGKVVAPNVLRRLSVRMGTAGLCLAASTAWGQGAIPTDELRATLEQQRQVAVTIYNDDLALIKDVRRLNLPAGLAALAFRDVSARIRPETAQLRGLGGSSMALRVLEQNFDFDLLSPQKLLEKYVGQTVGVVRTHPTTGAESTENAHVLAVNGGVVLRMGDRIETGVPGRLTFPGVPQRLRDRPTLVMQIDSQRAGEHDLELSYLTSGLGWRADYVAELGPDDKLLDLSGWVTLTNTSGTSYRNARLQLVAGEVNRAAPEAVPMQRMGVLAAPAPARMASDMSEQALFEYHLYTLERPTTLAENQTKQVALLSASAVPVRKEFVLRGADYYYRTVASELGRKLKIGVFIEFDNKSASHLGVPLPKGVVRVYKQDQSGNAQFVGEDRIDHIPRNEKVRLKLGQAFDITADKRQTDFRQTSDDNRKNAIFESAFEITLRNGKDEAVKVQVQEPIPGDWKMLQSSHPHSKAASNLATWSITVPPQGSTLLTYRVQTRW